MIRMSVLFVLLAFALTVTGKRLCDNEHVQLDFGPDDSFIASFTGGGGVETVFVHDMGNEM